MLAGLGDMLLFLGRREKRIGKSIFHRFEAIRLPLRPQLHRLRHFQFSILTRASFFGIVRVSVQNRRALCAGRASLQPTHPSALHPEHQENRVLGYLSTKG